MTQVKGRNILLAAAIEASIEAGREILKVYETEFDVEKKADQSPLTLADKNAHQVIVQRLSGTGLPILSEEGRDIPYEERELWELFWMVDPLDGTKEFVKRNGEFTVNIALISSGRPVAGVIYVPVKQMLYAGTLEMGAFIHKTDGGNPPGPDELFALATRLPVPTGRDLFTAVASRSHMSPETEEFISGLRAEHGEVEIISMGSSLKICLVAEGRADIYPRFAPTMEWDTAAGHAIASAAGKEVYDYHTGQPMRYNKENLLNNWFVVR